jgi:hypothetical protein
MLQYINEYLLSFYLKFYVHMKLVYMFAQYWKLTFKYKDKAWK